MLLRQRGRQRAGGSLRAEEVASRCVVHGARRTRACIEDGVGGEEGAVRAFACARGSLEWMVSSTLGEGQGRNDGNRCGLPRTKMSVPDRCAAAGDGELVMAVCVCLRMACWSDFDFGSEVCMDISLDMR